MSDELLRRSATELLRGYAAREFSPLEVIAAAFDAIHRHDARLRCFLALNEDDAYAAARQAETRWMSGDASPLCGVPVSVKDSTEMAGMPTTYGSVAFKDNVQPDAALVTRLRDAGAVILGKTNLPEFALSPETSNRLGPPTLNPWDNSRSAGGSSGGAGAAVAAGFGPIAMGTDSGGSIRCPAAYNGVFGLKPTYQRIPAVQRWRAAPGRSHNGPLTRTVDDAALLMSVLAGPHRLDPDSNSTPPPLLWLEPIESMHGKRVALFTSESDQREGGDVARVAPEAARLLAGMGAEVFDADLPRWEPFLIDGALAYSADHFAAAETMIPGFWEAHADDLTPTVREMYARGQQVLAWRYRQAMRHDQEYREHVKQWFVDERIDFALMQATGVAPPVCTAEDGVRPPSLRDLVHFNMARNPAASVPFGFDSATGMPIALQVIGRFGDDVGVLGVARLIEAARPWRDRWPSQGGLSHSSDA